jgi:hypothetical protein
LRIGTGTGVVSIALAALRGKISQPADGSEESVPQEDHILATDLGELSYCVYVLMSNRVNVYTESALPLLHDNISSNHQHAHRGSPRGVELDWDSQTFPSDMADDVERYRTHGLDLILCVGSWLIRLHLSDTTADRLASFSFTEWQTSPTIPPHSRLLYECFKSSSTSVSPSLSSYLDIRRGIPTSGLCGGSWRR